MQSLKHYKVLHEHDNLTGGSFFPTPDRAQYGTDKPELPITHWNRYNPPPRPAFVGGKGNPCEGSLCEEES
jgi:hypothetical protein